MVLSEHDSGLVVTDECGGNEIDGEELCDERVQPQSFFGSMGSSHAERYDLLTFSTPRNSAVVQEEKHTPKWHNDPQPYFHQNPLTRLEFPPYDEISGRVPSEVYISEPTAS